MPLGCNGRRLPVGARTRGLQLSYTGPLPYRPAVFAYGCRPQGVDVEPAFIQHGPAGTPRVENGPRVGTGVIRQPGDTPLSNDGWHWKQGPQTLYLSANFQRVAYYPTALQRGWKIGDCTGFRKFF